MVFAMPSAATIIAIAPSAPSTTWMMRNVCLRPSWIVRAEKVMKPSSVSTFSIPATVSAESAFTMTVSYVGRRVETSLNASAVSIDTNADMSVSASVGASTPTTVILWRDSVGSAVAAAGFLVTSSSLGYCTTVTMMRLPTRSAAGPPRQCPCPRTSRARHRRGGSRCRCGGDVPRPPRTRRP